MLSREFSLKKICCCGQCPLPGHPLFYEGLGRMKDSGFKGCIECLCHGVLRVKKRAKYK